jgi:tRNA uridine 5-carbamoylmethylation protein Kti12
MSQPICVVMVGLPGMGKSTFIANTWKGTSAFIYSTDKFIEEAAAVFGKTYDEMFEDNIKGATESMSALLVEAIKNRQDIIWDQTNLGVGKRRKIINRMKEAGYQVCCACIIPPEEGWFDDLKVWKRRLESRPGKTIPNEVISNMMKSFVVPTLDEGFDMIMFHNMHGALIGTDYNTEEKM